MENWVEEGLCVGVEMVYLPLLCLSLGKSLFKGT